MKYNLFTFIISVVFIGSVYAQEPITVVEDEQVRNNYTSMPTQMFSIDFPHAATDYIAGITSEIIDVSYISFESAMLQIQSSTLTSGDIGSASYLIMVSNDSDMKPQQVTTIDRSNNADTMVFIDMPYIENYGCYDVSRWLAGARQIVIWASGQDSVSRKVKLTLK